jgi:hypothetical protein
MRIFSLSPFTFKCAFITRHYESSRKEEELKSNGTHLLLLYADDLNLLGEDINGTNTKTNTTNNVTEALH